VRLDAHPDGRTVFWLTRGREYLVIGADTLPVYDRHIITAARVTRMPDGGLKRAYCETAYASMPGTDEATAELKGPLTGKNYANPKIRPGRLTLWISASGAITQEVKLEKPKITSSYKGQLGWVNSPHGKPLLAAAINAHAVTATQTLDLTELGPFHPADKPRSDGFLPVTRDVIVARAAPAYLTDGASAMMIGIHPSSKFATIDEVLGVLTATESATFAPWFDKYKPMLASSEDVVIDL